MATGRLYTIGYQGVAIDRFVACLVANEVRTLADIRFHPYSRRPEFSRTALRHAIERSGIVYSHMKDLGNPPPSRAAAMAGDDATYRRMYRDHLATPAAHQALREVVVLSETGPVCLLCLEREPDKCHRLMVAEHLAANAGLLVSHLATAEGERSQLQLL